MPQQQQGGYECLIPVECRFRSSDRFFFLTSRCIPSLRASSTSLPPGPPKTPTITAWLGITRCNRSSTIGGFREAIYVSVLQEFSVSDPLIPGFPVSPVPEVGLREFRKLSSPLFLSLHIGGTLRGKSKTFKMRRRTPRKPAAGSVDK